MSYVIASIHKNTGNYSMAQKPHVHKSYAEASAEAARLARKFPDKKFVPMQLTKAFEFQEVVTSKPWEEDTCEAHMF